MERLRFYTILILSIIIVSTFSSFIIKNKNWSSVGEFTFNHQNHYKEIVFSKLQPNIASLRMCIDQGQVNVKKVQVNWVDGKHEIIPVNASLDHKTNQTTVQINKRDIRVGSLELWYDQIPDQPITLNLKAR